MAKVNSSSTVSAETIGEILRAAKPNADLDSWLDIAPTSKFPKGTIGMLDDEKKSDGESKVLKGERLVPLKLLKSVFSRAGMRFSTKLSFNCTLAANSGLGKYLQFMNGVSAPHWGDLVGSISEFVTLDAIFDEFWVKSVEIRYIPRNSYQQNSAASSASGAPGDLNTCAAMLIWLPYVPAAYSDASTAFQAMAVATQHHLFDLAKPTEFTAHNPVTFDWGAQVGEQSASYADMGWNEIALPTKLGGFWQVSTPVPTAATAAVNTLVASGVFGDVLMIWDMAFRSRA